MKKLLPLFIAGLMSGSALVFADDGMMASTTTSTMQHEHGHASPSGKKADSGHKKHGKKHASSASSSGSSTGNK